MDFLTEEQTLWKRTVDRFMDEEITREYIRECDRARRYPYEGYDKIAAQGWLRALIPEESGGDGGDIFSYALMCEALGKYCFDFAASVLVSTFTALNIVEHADAAQKDAFIGPFMEGRLRFSISISEPGVGSDAASVQTRARADGDDYVITGQKLWCSGAKADDTVLCMLVRTDPDAKKRDGLSLFLVPNDTPGMTIETLPTLCRRATGTNQVYLDNCRVPSTSMLGAPGEGWMLIVNHLEIERIAVSAAYVGNAQTAVDDALNHAHNRIQFDRPIFEFQSIQHRLADMQTRVDAARLLVYRAAELAVARIPCAKEVAMAKLFASEALQEVTHHGMQIMGGAGMLPESDMERYFREGMQSTIGAGTSEIQRTIIARQMGMG